jgi:hypothetical protein
MNPYPCSTTTLGADARGYHPHPWQPTLIRDWSWRAIPEPGPTGAGLFDLELGDLFTVPGDTR